MFGGLVMKEDRSKVIPTNDIYTLKLGGKNIQWTKHQSNGDVPLPRCNHSASDIGKGEMLVFGGSHSSNKRFNDVYILKTGT